MDNKVSLLYRGLWIIFCWWGCGPRRLRLWPLNGATSKYEGVVTHVRWGKGFSGQVRNPITEIIAMRREEDTLITIEGTESGEGGVAAII